MKLRRNSTSTPESSNKPNYNDLDELKILIRKKIDPLVQVYLPEVADPNWRNFIFRSMMYFSSVNNRTNRALAEQAIANLQVTFQSNQSAQNPIAQRFANAYTIHQFISFVTSRWHLHFAYVPEVKYYLNVDGAGFTPMM